MRWGGSISPHTAASRSKALGLGNCPSTVCAHSSSFLSHNLRLSHPKPRCDLGVHGLPSADDPSFQQPLPAPPCLGMQLGTAWEPGEVLSAHTGALQGGGIAEGVLHRPKGSWALVPAHGHRKDRVCCRRDGGRCLHHNGSLISPNHFGRPEGLRSSQEPAPPHVLGHPGVVPFLHPPASPAWVHRTNTAPAWGQNHISETHIFCMVSPQYPGEKPLGATNPCPQDTSPSFAWHDAVRPKPILGTTMDMGDKVPLGNKVCQPLPRLPHCWEKASTSLSRPTVAPCSPSSPAPALQRPREC